MKVYGFIAAMWLASSVAAPVVAQQPPSTATQPRTPTPAAPRPQTVQPATAPAASLAPRRQGQPINIKIEFLLTDQRSGGPAAKRNVSVVVADMMGGYIRSQSEAFQVPQSVPLNIDVTPELLSDGKIRLGFSVQYDSPLPFESETRNLPRGTVMRTSMHESVSLILENGKSMVAAQSADPIGDRQVTVEVKATILK